MRKLENSQRQVFHQSIAERKWFLKSDIFKNLFRVRLHPCRISLTRPATKTSSQIKKASVQAGLLLGAALLHFIEEALSQ